MLRDETVRRRKWLEDEAGAAIGIVHALLWVSRSADLRCGPGGSVSLGGAP